MEVSGQLHSPTALPQEKSPLYPLDRRLAGPNSRSGHGGKEKNSQPLPELEPPIIQPVVQPYTTELSRLSIHYEMDAWSPWSPDFNLQNDHLYRRSSQDDMPARIRTAWRSDNVWLVTMQLRIVHYLKYLTLNVQDTSLDASRKVRE
jgi:hypothetical protein